MPIGLASGCFIDYHDHRLLLTVQHATGDMGDMGDMGDWAAEIKFEPNKGTQLYRLGAMNFLKFLNSNNPISRNIDFAYVAVDNNTVSYFQEIEPNGNVVSEVPRKVCAVDFDLEPEKSENYGFSGQVMPSISGNHLITEHKTYLDLKYVGKDDDYLMFELPISHPGHAHFQGCSGAPIIDMNGNTVALVCKGDIDTNRIYGISLKKYLVAIDATYGDLAKSI
jgi:hypothetical protein